jgi:hypothetical protein
MRSARYHWKAEAELENILSGLFGKTKTVKGMDDILGFNFARNTVAVASSCAAEANVVTTLHTTG